MLDTALTDPALRHDISSLITRVGAEKESTKMHLSSLRRDVDLYRRQAKTLLLHGCSQENFKKIRHIFKSFHHDFGSNINEVDDYPDDLIPEKTYGILKQSLVDSQKRCQAFNDNMLKVADSNSELVVSLASLKNANKRLIEQLEAQSMEVSRLEQKAVLEKERIEQYQKLVEEDLECWRKETQFKIDDYTNMQNGHFDKMELFYQQKIARAQEALGHLCGKIRQLRQDNSDDAIEMRTQTEKLSKSLRVGFIEVCSELDTLGKTRKSECSSLEDVIHNLQVKLDTERDLHKQELEQWDSRCAKVTQEKEEVTNRLTEEEDRLRNDLDRIESKGEEVHMEFRAIEAELTARIEELAGDIASLKSMVSNSKRKTAQVNVVSKAICADNAKLNDSITRFREECHEYDTSLAEAVMNNEKLRKQMTDIRVEAQQENERDLAQVHELFDRKIAAQKTSHVGETHFTETETNRLTNQLALITNEIKQMTNKSGSLTHTRTMLQRVCQSWKQHYEDAMKLDQIAGEQYKNSKENWAEQVEKLEEQRDESISKAESLQHSVQQVKEEITAYSALSKQAITEKSKYSEELTKSVRETEIAFEETKLALKETAAQLQILKRNAAQQESMNMQKQQELIREHDNRAKHTEEARFAYESALDQERAIETRLSEQFHNLKEENVQEIKRWTQAPNLRAQALEKEIQEITKKEKGHLSRINSEMSEAQNQIEQYEAEHRRTQSMLDESINLYNRHRESLSEKREQDILVEKELEYEKRRVEKEYDAVLDKNASLTRDMDYLAKKKNEIVRRSYMREDTTKKIWDTQPLHNVNDEEHVISPTRTHPTHATQLPSRYLNAS